MPDQGVSADDHGVRLSESDQGVGAAEVIGADSGMDDAELHLVLGLQLAVFRPQESKRNWRR